jgi:transcriptional regulator with XRE-family HTH domain
LSPEQVLMDLRSKQGLTQKQFARRLGRSLDGIKAIEQGRYKLGRRLAYQISREFDVPVESLLQSTSTAETADAQREPSSDLQKEFNQIWLGGGGNPEMVGGFRTGKRLPRVGLFKGFLDRFPAQNHGRIISIANGWLDSQNGKQRQPAVVDKLSKRFNDVWPQLLKGLLDNFAGSDHGTVLAMVKNSLSKPSLANVRLASGRKSS